MEKELFYLLLLNNYIIFSQHFQYNLYDKNYIQSIVSFWKHMNII